MPPNSNARIWWDASVNAYRMTTPYNATFTEMLKQLIPYGEYQFNRDTKVWTFLEKYLHPIKALVDKTFGPSITIDRASQEKASQPPAIKTAPIDNVILQFFKLLPYDAVRKAYQLGAFTHHPDRGGDMGKMTDLNSCWQRIEQEFFKKGG